MKLNGSVMSRDRVIVEVQNGLVVSMDDRLVPLRLRSGDIEGWLSSRAIDGHRTNSRLLKKALRLTGADDAEVALKFNAATITDTYWWRPEGSELRYEDVRFKFNDFDKLALHGDLNSINKRESPTPELTNIGSFEKCWRLEDGHWWMYKQGGKDELFSELFICKLGQALGLDMAEYRLADGCIKSRDFTNGAAVNFESAEGLVGKDEDYIKNFELFYSISPEIAEQYLRIIYMDTLVFNADRHTQNYGLLRDVSTGAALRMAPNFDNNIALLAYGGISETVSESDLLLKLFCELLEKDSRAREMAARLPAPTREIVRQCVLDTGMEADVNRVCNIIMNRHRILEQLITQERSFEPTME